jgi:hypothetical protein
MVSVGAQKGAYPISSSLGGLGKYFFKSHFIGGCAPSMMVGDGKGKNRISHHTLTIVTLLKCRLIFVASSQSSLVSPKHMFFCSTSFNLNCEWPVFPASSGGQFRKRFRSFLGPFSLATEFLSSLRRQNG